MEQSLVEQRIALVLSDNPLLAEIVAAESGVLELLTSAADLDDASDRWQHYEDLKAKGSTLVGMRARNTALQSSQVYEAYLQGLDALLPIDENDKIA